MFFVLTQRVYRVARDAGSDKFGARHTSHTSWHVSGPFTKKATAERAALSAMATHTCLNAQILSRDQFAAMHATPSSLQRDYQLGEVIREAFNRLVEQAVC